MDLTLRRTPASTRYFTEPLEGLENAIPLQMLLIPNGTFMMGSAPDEPQRQDREGPQHEVALSQFFMGRYPITQAQWKVVSEMPLVNQELEADPSSFKGADRPVENVSWHDVIEFCDRISAYTNRTYRLPSESEWEYACRAGTTTPFHFGPTLTSDIANYDGNFTYADGPKGEDRGETTLVDHFNIANAFGLSDMHGNVWEWCLDNWHKDYKGAPIDGSAWVEGGDLSHRVLRGGSWIGDPESCRSAYRDGYEPDYRYNFIGFRVCCSPPRTQ